MEPARFREIADRYRQLRVAIVGDFCLDRYLEIDPARPEVSLETGLPVHNVMNVRAQAGGAGTILNNLSALTIGTIYPVGFVGEDGEGFELWRALEKQPGVSLEYFLKTDQRRTFTYCKPLVLAAGQAPQELNRLDSKNWTPTPPKVRQLLVDHFLRVSQIVDAAIVLDQVDIAETGVVTRSLLEAMRDQLKPGLIVLADSRRGLRDFPPVIFKMNGRELSALTGRSTEMSLEEIRAAGLELARKNGQTVFITLAECGILGASPAGILEHVPALPVRGPIDIVGAGDAVTANLAAALAAGANLREALELANAAASVVIHKLGTTGTANPAEISEAMDLLN